METIVFEIIRVIYNGIYRVHFTIFVSPKLEVHLKKYSPYYNQLGNRKRAFRHKVWEFIRNNDFVGREAVQVRLPLKAIIASRAVQLSFHLPDECFDHYERIIIYKDYYLSRFTKKYHKAEVNPALKVIVFSIRAIYESLKREDDGLNVLLHEFAHALWLEHKIMHNAYTIFDERVLGQVEEHIKKEMAAAPEGDGHFFRQYAFSNEAEFFAVAVENFFERPAQFRAALPEFYALLTRLLKQDPAYLS